MTISLSPTKTFAVVVGIEKYDSSVAPDLDGPANDACAFAAWLRDRDVPAVNVRLFLSPVRKNEGIEKGDDWKKYDFRAFPADSGTILSEVFQQELPCWQKQGGDLLVVFWGGHGVTDRNLDRFLLYPDATDNYKICLKFQDFLTYLRKQCAHLAQHACFVDACGHDAEAIRWRRLIAQPLPEATSYSSSDVRQSALYATQPGQGAKNTQYAGLFSRELLVRLRNQPGDLWPPDVDGVYRDLHKAFTRPKSDRSLSVEKRV